MKLFNGKFEMALRVMLILDELGKATENDILTLDLVATYGKSFGLSKNNLHGDNQFNFSEIATRKQMIRAGIAYLRLYELVKQIPNLSHGYEYELTKAGKKIIEEVNDDYSYEYQRILQKASTNRERLFTRVRQHLMKKLR